jgi:tetratricopeptide (TPR) repeat protein
VLILLLGISACATTPQTRQLLDHPPEIPSSVELKDVPFYPQQKYQCGPAALATVINYYQQSTTPEQLLPMVYIPKLKGSLQAEMLAAVRQYKLLAIEQDGQLSSILKEVAAGHPVLVLQNLGYGFYPFWHYSVIVGYDLAEQQFIMRSGEIERLLRPFSVFERTWARSSYWSVVAVPPDVMPKSATQKGFTQAAVALEPKLQPELSAKMYRNGHSRWPQSYVLLMGQANATFAQKDYAKAEALYQRATELDKQRAEGWNNLAYAQLYQGKLEAAISSVNQAVGLEPDNLEYQSSKREILSAMKNK